MILGSEGHHDTISDPEDTNTFDVTGIATEHLSKVVLEQELEQRRQHADFLEAVAEADRRNCVRDAIHRNLSIWLADHLRIPRHEATRTVKLAKLAFTDLPALGAKYRTGALTLNHLRLFLTIWNRKELRPALERDLDALIGWCSKRWPECSDLFEASPIGQLAKPICVRERSERR